LWVQNRSGWLRPLASGQRDERERVVDRAGFARPGECEHSDLLGDLAIGNPQGMDSKALPRDGILRGGSQARGREVVSDSFAGESNERAGYIPFEGLK